MDCCCFLIIHFFTKRLLSSFHKAVSPLDLRIGMLAFQFPLGISKFFLILKLTLVWRNYTNSHTLSMAVIQSRGKEYYLMVLYLPTYFQSNFQDEDSRKECCSCLTFVPTCRNYGLCLPFVFLLNYKILMLRVNCTLK